MGLTGDPIATPPPVYRMDPGKRNKFCGSRIPIEE